MSGKSKGDNCNIQVFARVRPSNALEVKSRCVVDVKSDKEVCVKDSKQSNSFKTFSFNHVFGPKSSQIDVYRQVVQPLIEEVLTGYNCTVFAYGQTGTGKTFTMEGERSPDSNVSWENDPLAGIVPRTLSQLFEELRLLQVDFCVKVSFLELYNEELIDLLSPEDDTSKLRIFEDATKKGSVIISGLEEVAVQSKTDVYRILEKGSIKRQTAATLMNAHSSRSHTVFTVTVHIKESSEGEDIMRTGKINLVDLAGSENIGRSGAMDKRAREAGNINQSLLTLGRVITALVDHSPHIPYRESKLTRILQESLGGCTKTSIIATVSPALCNLEETLSTLDYAHRAKNIQNKPQVNQRFCKKTLLKEYSEEIERLQRDLEATRQRTGIYLDQEEYNEMILRLDQLDAELKSKEEHMAALAEELEKKQAICDELEAQSKVIEETLKERTAVIDSQNAKLSEIRTETSEVVNQISETDHLMLCHVESQRNLTAQASILHQKAVASIADLELLHDKIDRTRNASQHNETVVESFEKESTLIVNKTKDLVNDNVTSISETASALLSTTSAKLHNIEEQIGITSDVAQVLLEVPSKEKSLMDTMSDLSSIDQAMLRSFENQKYVFSKASSDIKEEQYSQVMDSASSAELLISNFEKALEEIKLGFEIQCGTLQEVSQDWSAAMPAQLSSTIECATEKIHSSVKTLDKYAVERDHFYQEYLDLQEKAKAKLQAIRNLATEVRVITKEAENLAESHFKSSKQDINSMITVVDDAMAHFTNSEAIHQSQIEAASHQILELLDNLPKHATSSLTKFDFNPPLLPMENILQLSEKYRDALLLLENKAKEECRNSTEQCQLISTSCVALTEEIEANIDSTNGSLEESIGSQALLMNKMRNDILEGERSIVDKIEALRLPVSDNIEEFQNSVEHVRSFGAKAATPTGKTPQRSDLSIPRDLTATSPHERILSRLRSRYQLISKISPTTSLDSAYYDEDSDMSLSESEPVINKEKENSTLSNKVPAQKRIPTLIKMRKPLSENN